jgi:tRNA pseudouridine32 synthase/23S rRNA pseudouridine746 synthase
MHYRPGTLARAAAEDLMKHLSGQPKWSDHFGVDGRWRAGNGKMFGVLVVDSPEGRRYLAAFSGKLVGSTQHAGFVPPVYDLLDAANFYRGEEAYTNALTAEIDALEASEELRRARDGVTAAVAEGEEKLAALRRAHRAAKADRHRRREQYVGIVPENVEQQLRAQSIEQSYAMKRLRDDVKEHTKQKKKILDEYLALLTNLKERRTLQSNSLQDRIFSHYRFLDAHGKQRDALSIFADTALQRPPAGAGDCAAPKLLQYAFRHGLQPLTFAEFWWGAAPAGSLRRHRSYYPACRGKCEPILTHMLRHSDVATNPLLANPAVQTDYSVRYEDDDLLVVSKPANMLSVPGRHIRDSVQERLRQRYAEATGPLLVHRLDMSTSGLLLVAKSKHVHRLLQRQFGRRTVNKRYVAMVGGSVKPEEGEINLPLRGNYADRPRQMVCRTEGKSARTRYRVVGYRNGQSFVHFWPITGRTHQLRVHAAHPEGLDAPIVGDDLYGDPGDRLYLHAEEITFRHPVRLEWMTVSDPAPFGL